MIFGLLAEGKSLFVELYEYFRDKYFTMEERPYENFKVGNGSLLNINLIILGLFAGIIIAACFGIYNKRVLGRFVRTLNREGCNSPESAKTLAELGFEKNTFVRSSLKSGVTLRRVVRCVGKEGFADSPDTENSPEDGLPGQCEAETSEIDGESKNPAGATVNTADTAKENGNIASSVIENNGRVVKSVEQDEEIAEEGGKSPSNGGENGACVGKSRKKTIEMPKYKFDFETDRFYIAEEDKYTADVRFDQKGTSVRGLVLIIVLSLLAVVGIMLVLPELLQMLDNMITGLKGN